jgi:hypothetical protein
MVKAPPLAGSLHPGAKNGASRVWTGPAARFRGVVRAIEPGMVMRCVDLGSAIVPQAIGEEGRPMACKPARGAASMPIKAAPGSYGVPQPRATRIHQPWTMPCGEVRKIMYPIRVWAVSTGHISQEKHGKTL